MNIIIIIIIFVRGKCRNGPIWLETTLYNTYTRPADDVRRKCDYDYTYGEKRETEASGRR